MNADAQRTLIAGTLVAALIILALALLIIGSCEHNLPLVMSGVSTIIGGLLTALNTPSGSRTATPEPGTVVTTADPQVPTKTTTETNP